MGLPVRVIHSEQKSVLCKRQRAHDLLRSRIELNHSSDLTLADPHEACERHDSRGIDGLRIVGGRHPKQKRVDLRERPVLSQRPKRAVSELEVDNLSIQGEFGSAFDPTSRRTGR